MFASAESHAMAHARAKCLLYQVAKLSSFSFPPCGRFMSTETAAMTRSGCTSDLDFSLTSIRSTLPSPEQNWECSLLVMLHITKNL